jgi:oligopeptide transport system ATP-binding protein
MNDKQTNEDTLLRISNLSVSFDTYAGEIKAVQNVSFLVNKKEIVSIVGESGSGKSVMTQSIVKLLPSPPSRIKSGEIIYNGENILEYNFKKMRNIKGKEIAYIFQDPMTSLNPTMKIGTQITEAIYSHRKMKKYDAILYSIELLRNAGISNPERRIKQYPYELSGGMRQRVMIAMAIALKPQLLIADEPTTALDVTIQSQILGTLKDLNKNMGMAIILITHNMGIVANIATKVIVMYGGKIVEIAPTIDIFESSLHPYTRALLTSVPRIDADDKKELSYIIGSPPDMLNFAERCPFAPRCKYSMNICYEKFPREYKADLNHSVYCFLLDKSAKKTTDKFFLDYSINSNLIRSDFDNGKR